MESGKIKIDDALISTDVDKLIKIISERKKLNFVELQRLAGIKSRNDLETWIRVLEDEGYVKIEYGITGTYIIWAGGDYYSTSAEELPVSDEALLKKEENDLDKKIEEISDEDDLFKTEEKEDVNEKTPEELLEEYVKMKRALEEKKLSDVDKESPNNENDIKKNILKKVEEDAQEVDTIEEIESEESGFAVDENGEEEIAEPLMVKEELSEQSKPIISDERKTTGNVVDDEMRDLITAYMEEIKEERARLEQLKRKKETFYKEELSALQKMSEGELLSFIDAVLAHEKKLLELRENILELPEKVEAAVRLKNELKRLGEEGRNSAKNTKEKIEHLTLTLKVSAQDVKDRMEELKTIISENEKKINALENIKESINMRAEKVELSIGSVKEKIEELNGMLQTLQDYLNETKKTKDEISVALEDMKKITAEKRAELDSIENEFDELNKLSAWIREYVNDYDSKIAEIEENVQRSERDILALKQAAEAAYLKRYLSELQSLSEKYEDKLEHAIKTEKEINADIEQAKERIAQLIKQSQKLVEKIGKETADIDYDSVKKRAEARSKKLRSIVEEKDNEKRKLSESIKKKKKK
ncbi:MAG: hypothetical protein QXS88_04140 [Candidatus Bilamarchaeaceae archaeon]